MTSWEVATAALGLLLACSLVRTARGGPLDRLVGLLLAGALLPLLLVSVALATGNDTYLEVALVAAAVSVVAGLLYTRALERWL